MHRATLSKLISVVSFSHSSFLTHCLEHQNHFSINKVRLTYDFFLKWKQITTRNNNMNSVLVEMQESGITSGNVSTIKSIEALRTPEFNSTWIFSNRIFVLTNWLVLLPKSRFKVRHNIFEFKNFVKSCIGKWGIIPTGFGHWDLWCDGNNVSNRHEQPF